MLPFVITSANGSTSVVYHGWESKMVVNLVGDLCPIVDSTMYVFILNQ